MRRHSCECINRFMRAWCKPCMGPQFAKVTAKWIWLNIMSFTRKDLLSCYIKQNNECLSSGNRTNIFIRWNGTFHFSTHENSCTIALINIHFLYNNNHSSHWENVFHVQALLCRAWFQGPFEERMSTPFINIVATWYKCKS